MDFVVFRRMRRSHTRCCICQGGHTPCPEVALCKQPVPDMGRTYDQLVKMIQKEEKKETWGTHGLLEPPGAHGASGDKCVTPRTLLQVQSSLQEDPTSRVGSSTLSATRREMQLEKDRSWQEEMCREGESRDAEEGMMLDVPVPPKVSQEGQTSTYWPPCHVSASKEIAADGVPVHPA